MGSSGPGNSKPCDRIALDGVQPGQFETLVDLIAELVSADKLRYRLTALGNVVFAFDETSFSENLKSRKLPSSCVSLVKMDIPIMVYGILSGFRGPVTSLITEHSGGHQASEGSKATRDMVRKEVTARMAYAEKKLVTDEIRQQYALKRTAKNNTYLGLSWEVVSRRSSSDSSHLRSSAHAIIRIVAQRPVPSLKAIGEPFQPLPSYDLTEDAEALTLTMTAQDVRAIIEDLEKAGRALTIANDVADEKQD